MKLNIYFFTIVIISCLFAASLNSSVISKKLEETSKASQAAEAASVWNFELYNKYSKPIVLSLQLKQNNNTYEPIKLKLILPGAKVRIGLNDNSKLRLCIWTDKKDIDILLKSHKNFMDMEPGSEESENYYNIQNKPFAKAIIYNPKQKTVFLTFDQSATLRPAGGTIKGFFGVGQTASGLSLKNNITTDAIHLDADWK